MDGRCGLARADSVAATWPHEALVCLGERGLEGCWGVVEAVPPGQEREGILVLDGVVVRLSGEYVSIEGSGDVELDLPCRGSLRLPLPARLRVYVWAGTYTLRVHVHGGSVWHLVLARDTAYAYRVVAGGESVETVSASSG